MASSNKLKHRSISPSRELSDVDCSLVCNRISCRNIRRTSYDDSRFRSRTETSAIAAPLVAMASIPNSANVFDNNSSCDTDHFLCHQLARQIHLTTFLCLWNNRRLDCGCLQFVSNNECLPAVALSRSLCGARFRPCYSPGRG